MALNGHLDPESPSWILCSIPLDLKLKDACSWLWGGAGGNDKPREHIKKQSHYFAEKGPSSQSYGFSNSHVQMWEWDARESWAMNNWCLWTVVLEKVLESPLAFKEIKPVYPKGSQSWIFIWKTCWSWSSSTLATLCEELTHWKRPWCWETLKAGGKGDNRG